MTPNPEMLDELLKDCKTPKDVESLYSRLLQRVVHLAPGAAPPEAARAGPDGALRAGPAFA